MSDKVQSETTDKEAQERTRAWIERMKDEDRLEPFNPERTEPDAPPSSPEAPRAPIPVIPPDWFKKTSNPRPQLFYNRLIIGLTFSALAAAVVLVFRELW